MIDLLIFFAVAIPLLLLLTGVAIAPAVGLSFYLATNRRIARMNVGAGILSAMVGLFVGGLLFDPVARTPPSQAYMIVGAWLGGTLGVVVATIARFLVCRKQFRLQLSLRSLFVVMSLVCVACAIVAFVWSRAW